VLDHFLPDLLHFSCVTLCSQINAVNFMMRERATTCPSCGLPLFWQSSFPSFIPTLSIPLLSVLEAVCTRKYAVVVM